MSLENPRQMTLYSTGACHLCEQAAAILDHVVSDVPHAVYHSVDISDSDELFERYGWHIPVVGFADGAELYWPFDEAALRARLLELPAS